MIEIDHLKHSGANHDGFNSKVLTLIRKGKILVEKNHCISIQLTKIEYAILALFAQTPKIPISNEDIIIHLRKDPEKYKGLCMCINRLQRKFEEASQGEKLFRSVRNNGYRIIQKLESETV